MFDYIVETIKENIENANIINEDDYYDELHSVIDDWVAGSTGEAKDLVNNYGFLNAIRLYQEEYGDFVVNDDDNKVYMTLSYCIIKNWFDNNYEL
jgi:hypothetical protein